MSAFREWMRIPAVLTILLAAADAASAQPSFQCASNAGVSPLVRAEGETELTGDLVLNCTGGTSTLPGAAIPQVTIQIFLNTALTSRLLGANGESETVLMIDEPQPVDQTACTTPLTGCAVTGVGGGAQATDYKGGRVSVFQGVQAGLNSVVFNNVPVDPPGTSGVRVLRITNIRANASQFFGAGGPPSLISASITANPSTSLPIANPQQFVGLVVPGLNVTITGTGNSYQQCSAASRQSAGSVTFREGFATAFKTRTTAGPTGFADQNLPGAIFNTETGFYSGAFAGTGLGGAGLADFGTRFQVRFTNLQPGVTITADASAHDPNTPLSVQLTATEGGPYSPSAATTFTATALATSVTFVYEVTQTSPNAIESVTINFLASWNGPPNSPDLGTNNIAAWFAPTTTVTVASHAIVPVPRFADFSRTSSDFSIVNCACPGPVIHDVSANPNVLWPPDHKMTPVKVNYTIADDCDPAPVCSLSVSVNKGEGRGSGNTSADWLVLDAHDVALRAERSGTGQGRIYTIAITCTDTRGLSSSASVAVTVPHDRGSNGVPAP